MREPIGGHTSQGAVEFINSRCWERQRPAPFPVPGPACTLLPAHATPFPATALGEGPGQHPAFELLQAHAGVLALHVLPIRPWAGPGNGGALLREQEHLTGGKDAEGLPALNTGHGPGFMTQNDRASPPPASGCIAQVLRTYPSRRTSGIRQERRGGTEPVTFAQAAPGTPGP